MPISTSQADATVQAVLAAEARRAQALCARDASVLAALLHPALRYVHATGLVHDRAAYLAYAAHGPEFTQVTVQPEQVHAWPGGAVLVLGRLHLRFRRWADGQPGAWQEARSWVSQVWCPAQGLAEVCAGQVAGWQLLALQSTREAEAA